MYLTLNFLFQLLSESEDQQGPYILYILDKPHVLYLYLMKTIMFMYVQYCDLNCELTKPWALSAATKTCLTFHYTAH